jgi:predicted metalloprotease
VPIALLACLISLLLAYGGEAFAQGADEGLVESVVSDVNAFWGEQFQLLGASYTPAQLVFINDQPVDTPCGSFSTDTGPAFCPSDGTLYYPLHWLDNGRTLADYGDSAVDWGIGHEIGHNAQVQLDALGLQNLAAVPLAQVEMQADCFAGMWAKRAVTEPGGIEAALAAMMGAGDPDHGTAQQRIAAFELGYNTGDLNQCLGLANGGDAGGTTTGGTGDVTPGADMGGATTGDGTSGGATPGNDTSPVGTSL